MFWLSHDCFSILYDAFLLKSIISSYNSCGVEPNKIMTVPEVQKPSHNFHKQELILTRIK